MDSVIRLLKSVPITKKHKAKASKELLKFTINQGFVFAPEVIANYTGHELMALADRVCKIYGLNPKAMNSSFHKSWNKVKNSSMEELVVEQVLHYITTYGFEALGVYDAESVYVPTEKLTIPELKQDKWVLVVINGLTKSEIKERLVQFLELGVALKDDTKKDVIDIATYVKFTVDEVTAIKNKEVRICLFDYLGMIPANPVEFLRYMIYKSTNKTLIIKNLATITEIKSKDNLSVLRALEKYDSQYGLEDLASIFYRFKPLFLAFRTNKQLKGIINRMRRLAVSYHEPMPVDYLNNVTRAIAQNGDTFHTKTLKEELKKVNTFRKIRLAYALKFRTSKRDSIMYRIRNGKSFATEFNFDKTKQATKVFEVVLDSIAQDLAKNIKGRSIYLPDNIQYSLPATEKQFTGDIPSGSYVVVPKDIIVGVHWDNIPKERVDLDLSLMDITGDKIGWDALYRSSSGDVLFSGDITDAPRPNGANEFFYIQRQTTKSYLLMLNNYTYAYNTDKQEVQVPFKIIVASEKVKNLDKNYIVNPNKIICIVGSKIGEKQKMLGLLVTTPDESRFYFAESAIGNTISSSGKDYTKHANQYLVDYYQNSIGLKSLLKGAGAVLVDAPGKGVLDLSLESIKRDTLMELFK